MLRSSCFFYQVAFCSYIPTRSNRSRSSFEFASKALLNPADFEIGRVGRLIVVLPADLGGFYIVRIGDPSSLAIFTNLEISLASSSLDSILSHLSSPAFLAIDYRAIFAFVRTSSLLSLVSL